MDYQLNFHSLAFLLTMIIALVAAAAAWTRRSAPGGSALFWMMAAVAEWNLMEFLEASKVVIIQAEIQATISLGIVEYPQHGKTIDELIAAVDHALYQAKIRGRNRVEVY